MAKDQSFAAKVAKAAASEKGNHCPTCGEIYHNVQLVASQKSEIRNSWKFVQKFIPVCKCNQTEVYG